MSKQIEEVMELVDELAKDCIAATFANVDGYQEAKDLMRLPLPSEGW